MSINLKTSIHNMLESKKKTFSVELCSNKDLNWHILSNIDPMFYSVTWHYQNINSINDIIECPAIAMAIKLSTEGKNVLLHLPCRYLSKQNVFDILTIAQQYKIKNIFALLGETIEGCKISNDFKYAIDLVKYIRENFRNTFCICVAGYPPSHPEQSVYETDLKYLKEKVDAGADFIITQVIFDIDTFITFYKNCRDINIHVPIIPGLYLINSYNTVLTMAKICHVIIPEKTMHLFQSIKDDNIALQSYAEELINKILSNDKFPIVGIHLFCLNKMDKVYNLVKDISFSH